MTPPLLKRILVTGATGNIGHEVVAQLRANGCPIRALTRRPESANLPDDVEVVRGDLTEPDTLDAALSDVDAVFLVWTAPLAAAARAVERMASHGERIVLLTSAHRTAHPFFQQPNALRAVHAGVEQLVKTSVARWTILQPGAFALNCRNWWARQIRNAGVVRWFQGGAATAPIHERDLAAVAVRALCDEGHDRAEYVGAARDAGGRMAAAGRRHAVERVWRRRRSTGVRHLDGRGGHWNAGTSLQAVGRRSRCRVRSVIREQSPVNRSISHGAGTR